MTLNKHKIIQYVSWISKIKIQHMDSQTGVSVVSIVSILHQAICIRMKHENLFVI